MRIRLIGQRNTTGIGIHYACFADALKRRRGLPYEIEEIDAWNPEAMQVAVASSQPTDVNVCFMGASIHLGFQGHNIQWTVFETTVIPSVQLEVLKHSDSVWVPSLWGQQVLINNGIPTDRVTIVPEGVDPDQFYPVNRPRAPGVPFRYVFNGKYEDRKSCRELVEAWARAYGNNPDVQLIIKSGYFKESNKFQELQDHVNGLGLANVGMIWGYLAPDQLAELYASADVFVFPSKGEGWGLPLIEAAAMGIPLITTFYSAQCDYLGAMINSCVFVDYDLKPVGCDEFKSYNPQPSGDWGTWAWPRVDSLAQALIRARAAYPHLSQNAHDNSVKLRQQWSWSRTVDHAVAAIDSVVKKQQNKQP